MNKTVIVVCKCTFKLNNKDNNNAFAKDKFRCSHKEVSWKYGGNSQKNTHAELWPQQICIATLLKWHFGTFKSSLCVTYFTVSSPNFIRREPFNTQNEDISLPDHSALHLDHKYLQ